MSNDIWNGHSLCKQGQERQRSKDNVNRRSWALPGLVQRRGKGSYPCVGSRTGHWVWLQGPAQPPASAQAAGTEDPLEDSGKAPWSGLLAMPVPALADGIHREKESLKAIPASQHCEKQVLILVLRKLSMLWVGITVMVRKTIKMSLKITECLCCQFSRHKRFLN